ncbi:uncharacterized protein BDV17DRAFT_151870 [Aspergillus undulatus]|uniref:uncharacterized protein n=1 Tax=Aspergillus undulatus TaxID=1810928 RepID=UPI003CCE1135
MSSSNIWLSSFIEHCLLSYETGRPDPGLNWEDDGSNIRFSTSTPQDAQINSWSEQAVPTANVTDLDTQIEARLSRQSLQDYKSNFPNKPLNRDSCRGYSIHLDDFELVYEYSTGKPKVHLYVKRFNIAWERGRVKGPPAGKSVSKKPTLAKLIRRVLSSIKNRDPPNQKASNTTDSEERNGNAHGDIPATQVVDNHAIQATQLQLVSQISPRSPTRSLSPDSKYDAAAKNQLLELLSKPQAPDVRQSGRKDSAKARSLEPIPTTEVRNRSTSHISTSGNGNLRLREWPATEPATEHVERMLDENVVSRPLTPQANENRPTPKLSHIEAVSTTLSMQPPAEDVVERSDSPNTPEKQLNDQLEASQHVTVRSVDADKNVNATVVDPWEGMTEIRSVDVTVPKDQLELLDTDPPWYPPPVGQPTVSGHVPPALLEEWNQLVLRWHETRADDKSTPVEDAHFAEPSTPTRESTSDHEYEEEEIGTEWSTSPDRTPSRGVLLPRDPLPGDTPKRDPVLPRKPQRISPSDPDEHTQATDVEKRNAKEKTPLAINVQAEATALHQKAQEDATVLQDGQTNVTEPVQADAQEAFPPSREQGSTTDTLEAPETANEANVDSMAAYEPRDDDAHQSDDGSPESSMGGSDGSSSNSEMEIVVPQPLYGSTQQESSQADGIPSSAASLPEAARRKVQVVETPAILSKSRPALINQNAYLANAEIQSAPDISSSQSRILNTYPSNEGDSKGETSQESSKFIPATAPGSLDNIHVMGTPLDSEAPQTQPTPWSNSNSLFTSSEPKVVEASKAAPTYHSQSPKAVSSYRDLPPSSMLSIGDQESPTVQKSARNSPLNADRASPLKRFASEVGDSERGSPTKRIKVDRTPTAFESENPDDRIIAPGLSRIINSAQSIEALTQYGKFRDAYPAYTGNFEHFAKLCSRLQAFREGGSLQRSFLWDDFVIKHIEDYPRYIAECIQHDTHPLEYEQYFSYSFSKPSYKKRGLYAEGISACAAQVVTVDPEEPKDAPEMADANISFTASLRDQLSKLHTHSFAATEDPSQDKQCQADWNDASSQYSIPDSEPARAAARGGNDEDMDSDQGEHTSSIHTNWMPSDEDEEMEDVGVDDTIHETASVELGDEDDEPEPVKEPSNAPAEPMSRKPDADSNRIPRSAAAHESESESESGSEYETESDEGPEEESQNLPHPIVTHPANRPSEHRPSNSTADAGKVPVTAAVEAESTFESDSASEDESGSETESEFESESESESSGEEEEKEENENKEPSAQPQQIIPTTAPPKFPSPSTKPTSSADQDQDQASKTVEPNIQKPKPDSKSEVEVEPEAQETTSAEESEESEEQENENWFSSLRHITFPLLSKPNSTSKPTWSESPNTPFKQWAAADLDVLSVRNRRGGIRIVDGKTREIRRVEPLARPRPVSRGREREKK